MARVFPYMVSKLNGHISFKDCRFSVTKQQEKTARVSLWKELRINQVYTLEASFFGYSSQNKSFHFKISDLLKIGHDILLSLYNIIQDEQL